MDHRTKISKLHFTVVVLLKKLTPKESKKAIDRVEREGKARIRLEVEQA